MKRNKTVLLVLLLLLVADGLCVSHTLTIGSASFSDTVRWLSLEAIAAVALILLEIRLVLPVLSSVKWTYLKKAGFSFRQPLRRLFVSASS
jgi:hypothetical protein